MAFRMFSSRPKQLCGSHTGIVDPTLTRFSLRMRILPHTFRRYARRTYTVGYSLVLVRRGRTPAEQTLIWNGSGREVMNFVREYQDLKLQFLILFGKVQYLRAELQSPTPDPMVLRYGEAEIEEAQSRLRTIEAHAHKLVDAFDVSVMTLKANMRVARAQVLHMRNAGQMSARTANMGHYIFEYNYKSVLPCLQIFLKHRRSEISRWKA